MTTRTQTQSALRVAIFDDALPARFQENDKDSEGLELVATEKTLDAFLAKLPGVNARVVVLNAQLFDESVERVLERVSELGAFKQILVLYSFLPREQVRALSSPTVRFLKQPITLRELRFNMMNLIMERIFDRRPDLSGSQGSNVTERKFTRAQLGRLQELSSTVQCECPQNLSELVQSLTDFEDYSKNCENRNADDAAVHTMLYQETARARAIMEDALVRLCKYEEIEL